MQKTREIALYLVSQGWMKTEIAKELEVSRQYVYYLINPAIVEKTKKNIKKYQKTAKGKRVLKSYRSRPEVKEKIKAYQKKYRDANKERAKAYRLSKKLEEIRYGRRLQKIVPY